MSGPQLLDQMEGHLATVRRHPQLQALILSIKKRQRAGDPGHRPYRMQQRRRDDEASEATSGELVVAGIVEDDNDALLAC
jgi:hypothetical protein